MFCSFQLTVPLSSTAHLAQVTPLGPGIPLHLTETTKQDQSGTAPQTHKAQGRLGYHCSGKGWDWLLSFGLWIFFFPLFIPLFFPPSFLIAKPAIGVENGEGGREENLVNSWGPSLFIAGLGEMWLTEWCTEAVPVNDFTILHHYPHH